MPLLKEISTSGFSGTAPTPVEKYAVEKYFTNNELFNLLPFVNIGMGNNIGNIQCSILKYDKPEDAAFRGIGEGYTTDNSVATPVTLTLRMLGGQFETDRVLQRSFSSNESALSNWTEQQIGQKINAIMNGFAKAFISGDGADGKQFDGLNVYFKKNPEQVEETPKEITGLNYENALTVEAFLNQNIAKVSGVPTCVITNRHGKAFLQSLEQHRNRGISAISVNDKQYFTFAGLPILALSDDCFTTEMKAKGMPFIFAKFDEQGGIRVAVPMDYSTGGQIIDIVKPDLGNGGGDNVFVKNGGVELISVPIIEDYEVASLCYVKETGAVAEVLSLE